MQRIIIGTAGHVDHGKSLLAKILTGVDPDRLPEEKQRAMTIDLGFVFFPISDREEVAIIDVPGHERFLRTMIAGANSIRLVLFVVAADEGIMPQTIEHLDILKIMGTEQGMVIITKTDKAEGQSIEMLAHDIRDLTRGSFLESAPILAVSCVTHDGIDELTEILKKTCNNIQPLPVDGIFRCPIDRIFTMKGFGTIIAGTVLSGRISKVDTIELLPSMKKSRIRNLQVHNEALTEVFAGQRAAFNLADLTIDDISKGCELSIPDYLRPTQVIDAYVSLLPNSKKTLSNNTTVHLHKGTGEVMTKIITLDKEEITPGNAGFVQFRMERPIVGVRNERFLIRSHSPLKVIGGGQLLEIYANKKSCRFKKERVEYLSTLRNVERNNLIETVMRQTTIPIANTKELVKLTNLPQSIVDEQVTTLLKNNVILKLKDKSFIHRSVLETLKERCHFSAQKYLQANPLKFFASRGELAKLLKISPSLLLEHALMELAQEGKVEIKAEGIRIKNLEVKISPKARKILEAIEKHAVDSGYQSFRQEDIYTRFQEEDRGMVKSLLDYLIKNGSLVEILKDKYLHNTIVSRAQDALIKYLDKNKEIRAPEYKDLLGISRDKAKNLLDYFLSTGVTIRFRGTHRQPTSKD